MPLQGVGYLAVIGAILTFGSFGVPIKSEQLQRAQVQPIIVQAYKSAACFGTCWLALLWAPLKFTWWGMLSAIIWVINGIAAVVAIQAAGLATSQALWSGISVFIAFLWGVGIFREPIARPVLAFAGMCSMASGTAVIGLVVGQRSTTNFGNVQPAAEDNECPASSSSGQNESHSGRSVCVETQCLVAPEQTLQATNEMDVSISIPVGSSDHSSEPCWAATAQSESSLAHESNARCQIEAEEPPGLPLKSCTSAQQYYRPSFNMGIGCAVFIGIANGSFMVPFKYASHAVTGLEFVVSFGIGAASVSCCSILLCAALAQLQLRQALQFKLRQAGPPALLAGVLWSCGNMLSIIATQELGMSIAWPAVQAQLLVSTAWGVLWYREHRNDRDVIALLGSTAVIILGVACLAAARGT